MSITVKFIYPPIPIRQFDYMATYDHIDEDPEYPCPKGFGATEQEAIEDLKTNYPLEDEI